MLTLIQMLLMLTSLVMMMVILLRRFLGDHILIRMCLCNQLVRVRVQNLAQILAEP